MFNYEELKTQPRKFLSQTSLTVAEFEDLLPAFEKAYLKKFPAKKTKVGTLRKRKTGAGRKSSLDRIEQKLLFALVYQKSYPLQSIMGELFGMGQSQELTVLKGVASDQNRVKNRLYTIAARKKPIRTRT